MLFQSHLDKRMDEKISFVPSKNLLDDMLITMSRVMWCSGRNECSLLPPYLQHLLCGGVLEVVVDDADSDHWRHADEDQTQIVASPR
jgi:hypothetical protein